MPREMIIILAILVLIPVIATAQNRPPVADAGPDQSTFTYDAILLQGSATDPDNNPIVDWLWTVESAPPGSSPFFSRLDSPDSAFEGDVAGHYILSLIASDGGLWSEPDSVTISVEDLLPPVAVATSDLTSGPAPLTVQFDGSMSYSPNGLAIEYDWNFGDGIGFSDDVYPSYTYSSDGMYNVVLHVVDSFTQTAVDIITITVGNVPTKPSTWGRIKALYGQ